MNIKLFINTNEEMKHKATFSIEVVEGFYSGGWKLFEGSNGYFISSPSYKLKEPKEYNGKKQEYQDYNMLKRELRDKITELVVAEYEKQANSTVDEFPF